MSVTIKLAHARGFPAATVVKAYAQKGFTTTSPSSGRPSGTELGEFTVASDGSLEITGAAEETEYVLAAEVSGVWKYLNVTAEAQGFRGANARIGSATLVAGKATVANVSVTSSSKIFLTGEGAITHAGNLTVKAKTAGTGFEIESTNAEDVRVVNYSIVDP